jgi:hypothetical protein
MDLKMTICSATNLFLQVAFRTVLRANEFGKQASGNHFEHNETLFTPPNDCRQFASSKVKINKGKVSD